MLRAAHSAVYDKYLRYQMIAIVFRGEAAAREHAMLLECALRRDASKANAILTTHIQSCLDYALADDPPTWASAPVKIATERSRVLAKKRKPASRVTSRRN